jgi:acylphosphatase
MADPKPAGRRWLIEGRVQGVGFRAHARRHALALGLAGSARNLPDGRVEVVAHGPVAALDELHTALARGPALGRVDRLTPQALPHDGSARGFAVG